MVEGMNGVTEQTPNHIPFGAGTFHKGLKYTKDSGWNFAESIVGATNGGSKLDIVPEYYDVPLDGVNVPLMETKAKIGEVATIEANMAELTEEILKASAHAIEGVSEDDMYTLLESKAELTVDDFWENVAFVGKTLKGKNIIAILPNALCTSGFSNQGQNKASGTNAYTFTCHASIEQVNLNKLPWKIYYPKATA